MAGRFDRPGPLLRLPLSVPSIGRPADAPPPNEAGGRPKVHSDDLRRLPPTNYGALARVLTRNGYQVLPVRPGNKHPAIKRWNNYGERALPDRMLEKLITAFPDAGVAIKCGSVVAIDIDVEDPELASAMKAAVLRILPGRPLERLGRQPRLILVYRVLGQVQTEHFTGFDIVGRGSIFVAWGVHPKTGLPYTWERDSPLDRPAKSLPAVTPAQIEMLKAALATMIPQDVPRRVKRPPVTRESGSDHSSVLVRDGRDAFMRDCVWHVLGNGVRDEEDATQQSWDRFSAGAEMTRPKRDGTDFWRIDDARRKVRYALRRNKVPRSLPSECALEDLAPAFRQVVRSIAAFGGLPPAAVKVSEYMLSLSGGAQGCFATPETIGLNLDLAVETVKRARRRLRELDLWTVKVKGGGRGKLGHYHPNFAEAPAIEERVTTMGTQNSIEREGDDQETGILEELENNKISDSYKVFEDLIVPSAEGEA